MNKYYFGNTYAEIELSEEEKRKFVEKANIDTEEADLTDEDFNKVWYLRRYMEDSDYPWELYIGKEDQFDSFSDKCIERTLGYTVELQIVKIK